MMVERVGFLVEGGRIGGLETCGRIWGLGIESRVRGLCFDEATCAMRIYYGFHCMK